MERTKTAGIFLLTFLVMTFYATACLADEALKEEQFKVVGYYSGSLFNEPVEKLQTDKLTHVIYAFLIPQEDGTLVDLEKPEQLKELVAQAHNGGTRVFIALGGWSYQNTPLQPVFETLAASPEKRKLLIDNICAFVEEYELDGVELDWEHPNANSIADYERLVMEMKAALDRQGKELTAALNGAWSATEGPEVSRLTTDACLESFSFINVMAYDMNNEEHSPLWFAETSVDYWLTRGVPANKIVLGMPLYARPSWLQYRHLIAQNPEYAYHDYAATSPVQSYYNGINTLREKTVIALSKAGGVMLFDINEDTEDETSIVSMIDDLLSRTEHLSKDELNRYITVILDNRELVFLPEEGYGVPFIDENNRAMIPLRRPLEAIGATVSYDDKSRIVTAAKDGIIVKLTIGANNITVNGREVAIDTRSIIKDGRTYIPLRAVLAAFGCDIEWHGNSRTILISSPTPGAGLTASPEIQALGGEYFDFAIANRLDYVPLFEAGKAPSDSTEYLYYAFALNLDNWGDDKGEMTDDYVEQVIRSHFKVENITHASLRKGWDYDDQKYTAVPTSIKEKPIYVLKEFNTYIQNQRTVYEITLDNCIPVSGIIPGEEDMAAIRANIVAGNLAALTVLSTESFQYYLDEADGGVVFLAHTIE